MDNAIKMRDFIFPIIKASKSGDGIAMKEMLGTAFFIGSNGFAITASHIFNTPYTEAEFPCALLVDDQNQFRAFKIDCEPHPSEDVCLIKIDNAPSKNKQSPLFLSNASEQASAQFFAFGYPADILTEDSENRNIQGIHLQRPDLVYIEGYIRRRASFRVPPNQGNAFYELNEIAGNGFSGSPIILKHKGNYAVIGVYATEKLPEKITHYDQQEKFLITVPKIEGTVSYAVRTDALSDWTPKLLGTSIYQEKS